MPPATISDSDAMASCVTGGSGRSVARRHRVLAHDDASLVMITSVATCIAPRMPAQ